MALVLANKRSTRNGGRSHTCLCFINIRKEKHMSTAASNTAHLQGLKVTAAKKSLAHNPQAHRRLKLAKKLWEQIELAKAQQAGTSFTMTRFRTVTTDEGIRRGGCASSPTPQAWTQTTGR